MAMAETVEAEVAGIGFRFVSKSKPFSTESRCLKGFAVNALRLDDVVTIDCHEVKALDAIPLVSEFSAVQSEDCFDPCRWSVGRSADGSEVIRVDYFDHTRRLLSVQCILTSPSSADVSLVQSADCDVLHIYSFPFFNLLLSRLLLHRDGFLIHSSAVRYAGHGLLFTAQSGTGKSTMARLWANRGASIVNDDMNAVRSYSSDSGCRTAVYNIPMPAYNQHPREAELACAFRISQSPDNHLSPLKGIQALSAVMPGVIQQPFDKASTLSTVKAVSSALQSVSSAAVGFNLSTDPDSDIVSAVVNFYGLNV